MVVEVIPFDLEFELHGNCVGLRAVSQKAEHWDFDLYFGSILTSTNTIRN